MYTIENKKIILVVYKLIFKEKWIGNALCSYEYNTVREGFKNILKIDLDIAYPLKKANTSVYKNFEYEVDCIENSSQSFDLINRYLKTEYFGTEIVLVKTIFEFNFVSRVDNKIRLTLIGTQMTPYEITSIKNGKYLTLLDVNEEEAINYAYENII